MTKLRISSLVLAVLMLFSVTLVVNAQESVLLYAEDGRTEWVLASDVAAQLTVGWYLEPVQRLYAEDGRSELFLASDVAAQLTVGWYLEPVWRLYAEDGRSELFLDSDVAAQLTVGWYLDKYVTMYSLDGRALQVEVSEIQAFKNVGWYLDPVAKLYARNGNTIVVPIDEVMNYRKVGWYPLHSFLIETTLEEASMFFGPFYFHEYYEGIPYSGDVARTYYRNSIDSDMKVEVSYANSGWCATGRVWLKDAFPYLKLLADEYGRLTQDDLEAALCDEGIYGLCYRENNGEGAFGSFTKLSSYEESLYYYFDYDHAGASVEKDEMGYVNINTATYNFYRLT